jgi:hypothetical protein
MNANKKIRRLKARLRPYKQLTMSRYNEKVRIRIYSIGTAVSGILLILKS